MGGESKQSQTQQSTTAPWQEAQPFLGGILSQLGGLMGKTGITGAEEGALGGLTKGASDWSQIFGPQFSSYAQSLLGGGGAKDQAGAVNQNYLDYQKNLQGLASNTNYDPMSTPGLGTQLQTLQDNITKQVNGSFAAAGRDGSGYNQKALGSGIAGGLAPVLTDQYNRNVQNQQGAASALYNAGNTNAGILSGMQQNYLQNQGAGMGAAGAALDAKNMGYNSILQAEAARRGIPMQALGLLAQIGIPIAGLGSQSTGSSTGTKQDSGMQQFQQFGSGLGSLFGGIGSLWKGYKS